MVILSCRSAVRLATGDQQDLGPQGGVASINVASQLPIEGACMTTIAERPLQAIPTIYNGIQLKSRFEAQAALLFDRIGWEWQYEPVSIMLPVGVNYMPDFWIPKLKTIIECRGYCSETGDRQIDCFSSMVKSGNIFVHDIQVKTFIVFGSNEVRIVNYRLIDCKCDLPLKFCPFCQKWDMYLCRCGRNDYEESLFISSRCGKLLIRESGSGDPVSSVDWDDLCLEPRERARGILLEKLTGILSSCGYSSALSWVENELDLCSGSFHIRSEPDLEIRKILNRVFDLMGIPSDWWRNA
jgi:hypothetical protein